ncbi:transposable element Tcb1 transposase [Trichonephila clavipes]|nr:transposable element Tcb1 transposase [Trichonephila clavipes]
MLVGFNIIKALLSPTMRRAHELKDFGRRGIDSLINEKIKSLESSSSKCYVDAYLEHRKELQSNGKDTESSFTVERLQANSMDLFFKGIESVSSTMSNMLMELSKHQVVQETLQEEMDSVVGRDCLLSWSDKKNLPKLDAAIQELYRITSQFLTTSFYSNFSRIIGKLEEGRSVTNVAAEFGIAHSIVSRLLRQFQTTGTAIRGFSSGRPRGTTPADDRYIVLQARRNRRQTAGEIARHTTQATGRPISRFTVARRLHGGGLFARRPVRCVPLTPAHRRRRSLWCREHRNRRDNEWGRVLFTDESRFSLSSDSHRILIWRERGSRNHPSNIIERDRYGGRGVLVWGGIMLGSRTDLHIFDAGSVNGTRYCNEILLPYVCRFRGAMGLQFLFMDDNALSSHSSCRTALSE